MKKLIKASMCVLGVSLLSGCATITEGTTQTVSVETLPVSGATCSLKNNKGKWFVNSTPASVTVHRSSQPLSVICRKHGYKPSLQSFKSTTKGMLAGNIVFGAVIGAGVDAEDGAAFRYPNDMKVWMKKR